MGDLGKSDDDVIGALDEATHALIAMVHETNMHPEYANQLPKVKDIFLQQALCLDPRKISEEYDRIRKVAIETGEDGDIEAAHEVAAHHLAGWHGLAADAFRDHMSRIKSFATKTQHQAIMVALQSLSALFGLAYHMRQSYYDLAMFTKAAAEHEIDNSRERAAELWLAIGQGVVKAALDMNPANFKSVGVDVAVEAAGALVQSAFGGDGDVVIEGYLDRGKQLAESFASEFEQLTAHLDGEYARQAEHPPDVLTPINKLSEGITDVGSPNFSYANFYTEEYPKDGPFVGRVEEERKKYAEETRERESEITKRLEDLR